MQRDALFALPDLDGDMSNRAMTILRDYSPHIEVYSIDESFLDLNGLAGQWESMTAMGTGSV